MLRQFLQICFVLGLCASLFAQQAAVAAVVDSNIPAAPVVQQPHTLLDGTPVRLRLSETISSADAKVGQEIPFETLEEVKVDDVVVLPKGATAIGTVTEASAKKSMGRGGKLNIAISYARLADQEKVALRAVKDSKGGGHVGAMTGAMVATAIVFFPAAPLFLFIHGKDISIPQGTEITAFVEGDMHLDMAKFAPAPEPAPMPAKDASGTNAQVASPGLTVESTPAGADIEIDGVFVGSTPSTVNVTPGSHDITVKKKGYVDWTRKMSINGGSIRLEADLEKTD